MLFASGEECLEDANQYFGPEVFHMLGVVCDFLAISKNKERKGSKLFMKHSKQKCFSCNLDTAESRVECECINRTAPISLRLPILLWTFVWPSSIWLCLAINSMILYLPVIDICAKNNLTNDSGCRISPGQHEHQRHTEHRREKGNPSAKIA